MKRKEYFKQSLWNVSVKIVVIAIIVFLSCLTTGITWGILYYLSADTVGIILFSIAAIILAYYIVKYGLMLIFNLYHFFVCLYLIDKLDDRQFALYKKFVYRHTTFLGERDSDVTKYLKKFNPIRYRRYKNILERQEEQDG